MKEINSLKSSAPEINTAVNNRVSILLGEIDARQLNDLAGYARYQCAISRWNPSAIRYLAVHNGHELVHEIIEDVLVGLENPAQGRHPRPEDLNTLDTFIVYLRGAIRSKRSTLSEHVEANTEHVALDACADYQDSTALQSKNDPAQEVEYADLKRVAFDRLRGELDGSIEINQALDVWKTNLPQISKADELGLTPKQHRNIQKRLRRIFRKLDFVPVLPTQTGKEIEL